MPEQGKVALTRADLAGKKYVQVGTTLIAKLGGDAGAAAMAIVIAGIELRIQWNGEAREDGHVWWRASIEALADDTGLGFNTVRRSLDKLVERGALVREKFGASRRGDQTYSYRIVLSDGEPDTRVPEDPVDNHTDVQNVQVADVPTVHVADVPNGEVAHVPLLPIRVLEKEISPPTPHGDVGTDAVDEQAGGDHPHSENARQALARLRAERDLTTSENMLMAMAFEAGTNGDPYDGYRKIRDVVDTGMQNVRSHTSVLRHRLGLPKIGSTA